MRSAGWVGALGWLLVASAPATLAIEAEGSSKSNRGVQEELDADRLEGEIERLLGAVRHGSPVVKPQAARQLAALGKPGADAVLEWVASDARGAAALPTELVEQLGRFGDERLRALLWQCLRDRDFPWRPAASRSVGLEPQPKEYYDFNSLTRDVLGTVRAAAVESIGRLLLLPEGLGERERSLALADLRSGLNDIDDRARRASAHALCNLGEYDALYYLAEELRRSDRYWESDSGKAARYAASTLLKQHLDDLHGYQARLAPDAEPNVEALGAIDADIAMQSGQSKPEMPPWVAAGSTVAEGVVGLELLSCRKGELHLTWTADDRLLVGRGRPFEVLLPQGSSSRLLQAIRAELGEVTEGEIYGVPGCDSERYRFAVEGELRPAQVHVLKGPDPIPELRPVTLNAVARELLATLPERGEDPRIASLRGRARETLQAVGGQLGERPAETER